MKLVLKKIKKLNKLKNFVGKPLPTILPISKVGSQSEVAPTCHTND